MQRIAYLTAASMLEGRPNSEVGGTRDDAFEHVLQFKVLRDACQNVGVDLVERIWDDPSWALDGHNAFIVGTTWDYTDDPRRFLARLEAFSAVAPLLNPLSVIRWNLTKTYLKELAAAGAPTVPTLWVERADPATLLAAFDRLGADTLVVKPVIGAGAWRQARIRRGEPLPSPEALPPADAMIQPFLPAAATEGEVSFIFLGGVFSHAVQKVPAPGDYRVQSIYGAQDLPHTPAPEAIRLATRVMDAAPDGLLYARVDMMRGLDGALALMELELIEPYLYPEQGDELGSSFASALKAFLGAADNTAP